MIIPRRAKGSLMTTIYLLRAVVATIPTATPHLRAAEVLQIPMKAHRDANSAATPTATSLLCERRTAARSRATLGGRRREILRRQEKVAEPTSHRHEGVITTSTTMINPRRGKGATMTTINLLLEGASKTARISLLLVDVAPPMMIGHPLEDVVLLTTTSLLLEGAVMMIMTSLRLVNVASMIKTINRRQEKCASTVTTRKCAKLWMENPLVCRPPKRFDKKPTS